MADMRVRLLLDLVNRLSPGAKTAARDIKQVKDAARDLRRERAGDGLAAGLRKVPPAARSASKELRGVGQAARQVSRERGPARLSRDLDKAAASAARLRREMVRSGAADLGAAAGGRGAALLAAGRGALLPLAGAYGGYRAGSAVVRGTVGNSISFEKAMADVRKKVDGMDDPAALAKMERAVSKWAIAYGRTREEVAAMVAEAGAAGVSRADMPEFIRTAIAAATAWDATADQTSNALAKIKAATGWGNKELGEFVDKVNALADAGSAKEMDVVDMFQRAGAAAKAAGVDFDASLAFLTAMNNVAIAPEVASRGFAAFSSRLRTASGQGKKVADGLKDLGLTPKGVEKGMKTNATGTMIDVLERLEKSADKASVAIKIFGREWWDEVARAGQALPEIRKNLAIVRDRKNWDGSAQNSLNIELSTTDKHLKRLSALTSEVGDKLGRWALPAINEGVERIIAGMDLLEKRAADQAQARADRTAEDNTAGRVAAGEALTPEERERMATDAAYRNRIQSRAEAKRTDRANLGITNNMRLGELEREREQISGSIETRRRAGATSEQLAYSLRRLEAILAEIRSLDPSRAPAAVDPRRPADQEERGQADRGEALALQERIIQLESRLRALDSLATLSSNPADRAGFATDKQPFLRRRAAAEAAWRNRIAPGAMAAGTFGLGVGGIPATARPSGAGPGILSFGTSVNGWAQSVRNDLDIDLGPAGMTMMERLTAGIQSGGAAAQAAAGGVKDGITGAFGGADLSGAGAAMMATLESGIRIGGARAVAAAQGVAAQVKAVAGAAGGAARGRINGALHDGVE
ncbi:phage tail tape measure protein [Bosea minatitlanensis]|uniref:Phage tail tape measure protein n=1 Tax=Bosea minatitlanensis TaxID=128782 RepID=A0ABW0F169_9HYPH|nr:phage tail tape measure protein [Bosea minatitlanensis]MCT4491817.1 phage tail tape measure protein [Bosea minatitlanensis]